MRYKADAEKQGAAMALSQNLLPTFKRLRARGPRRAHGPRPGQGQPETETGTLGQLSQPVCSAESDMSIKSSHVYVDLPISTSCSSLVFS